MNRWIVRGILSLGFLTSACVWSPRVQGTFAAWSPSPAATLTRCHTSQLAIHTDSSNSGMGHIGFYFRIHNRSSRTCTLFGYPGIQLLDSHGHHLHTVLHWGAGYLSGNGARRLVTLYPRGNAFFFLQWSHIPYPGQTCTRAPALLVTPPNTYRSIRVRVSPGGVDACGGIVNAGPVEPTRLP